MGVLRFTCVDLIRSPAEVVYHGGWAGENQRDIVALSAVPGDATSHYQTYTLLIQGFLLFDPNIYSDYT